MSEETQVLETQETQEEHEDIPTEEVDPQPPALVEPIRQWISQLHGSCVCHIGHGALGQLGGAAKGSTTTRRRCALALQEGVSSELADAIGYQLSDAGFELHHISLPPEGACRTLTAATDLWESLSTHAITADDLMCAVGGLDALSLAAYCTHSWCGGTELACIPLELSAAVLGVATPRGIDYGVVPEAISTPGHAKFFFIDYNYIDLDPDCESVRLARASMARVALADSEKSFSNLWDRAHDLAAGDVFVLTEQLVDTLKSRGRLVSSTSIAVRQSMAFGETFIRAVQALTSDCAESSLVGESLRFASRLSAGKELLSIDDVLAIDEILDRLAIEAPRVTLDPDALFNALKAARFARSSRFLLGLPRKLGQVRMSIVEDDLLHEHCQAWCAVHQK